MKRDCLTRNYSSKEGVLKGQETTHAFGLAETLGFPFNKEFRILMTLGESTTAGGWASYRERCWANQLVRLINEFQRVPVQLVNVGIGANVISTKSPAYKFSGKPAANERLEKHVLSNTANGHPIIPDLLVISYGLNDARRHTN